MPGPILLVAPTDLSGGATSLRRGRRLLADELGFYLETTVSGASGVADAARVVLADDLRDDEMGYPLVPGGEVYLYVRTGTQAGTQRRILRDSEIGYQGSRGAAVLSRPLPAPLTPGDAVEITSPLPIRRIGTVKGLTECVAEALPALPAVAKLILTGAGNDRISLADAPYLAHVDQILGVYDRWGVASGYAARPISLPYRIDADGTTRYLVLGRSYATDETVELAVILPGDRLMYNGVTWVYVTDDIPPLPNDDDRFAVPERWVLAFGMVAALKFLQRFTLRYRDAERDERAALVGEITARLRTWSRASMVLRAQEFPRAPAVVGGRPLVSGTVSGHGDGAPIESGAGWGWSW